MRSPMRPGWSGLVLLWVLMLVTACGGPAAGANVAQADVTREIAPNVSPDDLQSLATGNTAFALDLYQAVRGEPGNLFFSPYSISAALAMTYAGARGETEQQMAQTLHFALSQERLHPAFNALAQTLQAVPAQNEGEKYPFELHIANSLWGQQGYTFRPEFLETLARSYGAGLRLVDFKRDVEAARQAINSWVSEQTKDKIKDLIPPGTLSDDARLVLANAIYFKAGWRNPFEEELTANGPFTLVDGSQVSVPMMKWSKAESVRYAQGKGYQAVELPYQGDKTAMVLIVPDSGTWLAFESGLTARQLDDILAALDWQQVMVTMPKFRSETSLSLADTLAALGMPAAFTPGQADFSGMDGNRDLAIGAVLHKAFVDVNEAGTEAAAATAIVMVATGLPAEPVWLTVDRPFIYLIRDTQTGTILFMGRLLNPAE